MQPAAIAELLQRFRDGDERALSELFEHHRPGLVRMIDLRLDSTLRRRLDPSDVVQEAWLEAARRAAQWREQNDLPFHVWLRMLSAQALAQAQRRHLSTSKRDAERDVSVQDSRPSISA